MRKTGSPIIKEQIENNIRLAAEVDDAINVICKKIKEGNADVREYVQIVEALAKLVAARASL